MDRLKEIEGNEFLVTVLGDQVNFSAEDGTLLVILSRFTSQSEHGESWELVSGLRVRVARAWSTDQAATLMLAGGNRLVVDLSADAYAGPEGMILTTAAGQIVVWN